jgi:hypothetical protein
MTEQLVFIKYIWVIHIWTNIFANHLALKLKSAGVYKSLSLHNQYSLFKCSLFIQNKIFSNVKFNTTDWCLQISDCHSCSWINDNTNYCFTDTASFKNYAVGHMWTWVNFEPSYYKKFDRTSLLHLTSFGMTIHMWPHIAILKRRNVRNAHAKWLQCASLFKTNNKKNCSSNCKLLKHINWPALTQFVCVSHIIKQRRTTIDILIWDLRFS